MELGLQLDDDSLFGFSREDRTSACTLPDIPYNAKKCPPLWFNNETSRDCQRSSLKYRADWEYANKRYMSALELYRLSRVFEMDTVVDYIPATDDSSKRGLEEDMSRCLLHLGLFQESSDCLSNVVKLAENLDHVSSSLRLATDISRASDNVHDECVHIMKLLILHPHNSRAWIRLGDLQLSRDFQLNGATDHDQSTSYSPKPTNGVQHGDVENVNHDNTADSDSSADSLQDCDNEQLTTALTCYTAALWTLQRVQNSLSSFAKDTNLRLQGKVCAKMNAIHKSYPSINVDASRLQAALLAHEDTEETSTVPDLSPLQILRGTEEEIERKFHDRFLSYAGLVLS